MVFGKSGDDPTARRRRSPDAVLLAAREIVARHGRGESARSIARGLKLSRTSVDRIIAQYRAAQEAAEAAVDAELDVEMGAVLAKYSDGGMRGEDARTAEDVIGLNRLEFFRMRHLPAEPQVACLALFASGWRPPPVEPLPDPRDGGHD
jgi:hypothetical protein